MLFIFNKNKNNWRKKEYDFYVKIENLLNKIYKMQKQNFSYFLINNSTNFLYNTEFINKNLTEIEMLKNKSLEILKKSLIKYRELDKHKNQGVFLYTTQNFICQNAIKNIKYNTGINTIKIYINKNIFIKRCINITTLNLNNLHIKLLNKSYILEFKDNIYSNVIIVINLKKLDFERYKLNSIIKILNLIKSDKIYKKKFIFLFLKPLSRLLKEEKYFSYNNSKINMLLELYLKNKIYLEYFIYLYFLNIYIKKLIFDNKNNKDFQIYKWNVIIPLEFYQILDKFNFVFYFINLIPYKFFNKD